MQEPPIIRSGGGTFLRTLKSLHAAKINRLIRLWREYKSKHLISAAGPDELKAFATWLLEESGGVVAAHKHRDALARLRGERSADRSAVTYWCRSPGLAARSAATAPTGLARGAVTG